jgi:hypothetical protein
MMSVLKNKLGLSQLEFYHTARKMREDITKLLLRNMGVKKDARQDCKRWLIQQFRHNISTLLRDLMWNITAANTLYPTTYPEIAERKHYQNKAIMCCEKLFQEFQYCGDVLPVHVAKFMPFVDQIQHEIRLLKGWRKSNSVFVKRLGGKKDSL